MVIIILLVYVPVFVSLWFVVNYSVKLLFKDKYKKHHTVIGFLLLAPVVTILLGFLALTVLPFPADN